PEGEAARSAWRERAAADIGVVAVRGDAPEAAVRVPGETQSGRPIDEVENLAVALAEREPVRLRRDHEAARRPIVERDPWERPGRGERSVTRHGHHQDRDDGDDRPRLVATPSAHRA